MKNIKQPLWYLSDIAVIAYFLLIPKLVFAQDSLVLPAWFWNPPEISGVSLAVGYAVPYNDLHSSYTEAFTNGAWRLFVDKECRIVGGRSTMREPGGALSLGNNFRIIVDSSYFKDFSASLIKLDSAATDRLVIMLVGTKKVDVDRRLQRSSEISKSDTIMQRGFVTATGIAPQYYYETSSWEDAERSARIEAALSLWYQIKGLTRSIPGQRLESIIIETDMILKNVTTVSRAIDSPSGMRIVTVKANGEKSFNLNNSEQNHGEQKGTN